MVTAKEFWEYLCEELNYRFFAGVSCKGLKPLYDKMSSKFMHYVPTIDERVAIGMVTGARLVGMKGAVLMHSKNILDVSNLLLSFNIGYKIPILIICYMEGKIDKDVASLILTHTKVAYIDDDDNPFKKNLDVVIKGSEKENKPGILFIRKGDIK